MFKCSFCVPCSPLPQSPCVPVYHLHPNALLRRHYHPVPVPVPHVTKTWHMTSYSLSYEFSSKSVIKNKGLIIIISLHVCNAFLQLTSYCIAVMYRYSVHQHFHCACGRGMWKSLWSLDPIPYLLQEGGGFTHTPPPPHTEIAFYNKTGFSTILFGNFGGEPLVWAPELTFKVWSKTAQYKLRYS